jgi:hypothetical protein
MQHISEQVERELIAQGFKRENGAWRKSVATNGVFGQSMIILQIDASGRWLEHVDGFGRVEKDVDLRDYANDPAGAIVAVI